MAGHRGGRLVGNMQIQATTYRIARTASVSQILLLWIRILWAFKLNPYEKLNLRFDCPVEDIRRQFRKLSLMVHPDKCKHANASTAFECECRIGTLWNELKRASMPLLCMHVVGSAHLTKHGS